MTAGDEQVEGIWGAILLAATEIGVDLSPDVTRHLRWLLDEGFRIHGPAGTLGWLGIEPESRLPRAFRTLLGALLKVPDDQVAQALDELAGTWSDFALRFLGLTLPPGPRYPASPERPPARHPFPPVATGGPVFSLEPPAPSEIHPPPWRPPLDWGGAASEPTRGGPPSRGRKTSAKAAAKKTAAQRPSRRPPPPAPPASLAPEPDPPRTAYARLDAPEVAVVGVEIEVVVGLGEQPSPGVLGGALSRPAASVGPYTLSLQLVADGFRLREGETLRRDLSVTAAAPYPQATFHLTAVPQDEGVRARSLQVFYEVGGQTWGMAVRPVAVVRSADLVAGVAQPAVPPGVDLALPTDTDAPDLEIRILLDPDHDGRLLWTFNTRHAGIPLPDKALPTEIGADPRSFARLLVDRVNAKDGRAGIYPLLAGIGRDIAKQMPAAFWDLLRAVAGRTPGTPDVLILSQEPYVPWELARLEEPRLDSAAPPFLASQANVGRWVLPRQESAPSSRQRPGQPPPTRVAVSQAAVVSGVYDLPQWQRLKEAEGEADDLCATYGATQVTARSADVFQCLEGDPPADLLHFAVHGIYDPNGLQDGLMLTDGETLDPFQVEGSDLGRAPFVFLNACQVGAGNRILGDYGGMAAAFLVAGAAGVVAPLWSVKDSIAREIAKSFYRTTADGTVGPAAALREARKGFAAGPQAQSATYLAYQFFGHPALKLRIAKA